MDKVQKPSNSDLPMCTFSNRGGTIPQTYGRFRDLHGVLMLKTRVDLVSSVVAKWNASSYSIIC
jgi:hypothetical protein